ncbi:hypothetical protein P154DRAFT_617060 [Amniculicola lignicola CBS 123094]|uniref:Uncharacterized protein n=1 Tax=Amniculicola lignicola CBS 123094 TaxID=1392246 RepID=A0A6A5WUA6_9PLEO|nr:hypothetical protein P154DRAFT_617060 [Amniculicola lignicola CBS 123094]
MSPFPFMRLPTEIRLMVYELLPIETKRHHYQYDGNHEHLSHNEIQDYMGVGYTLILRSVPTAILGTCRTIYKEASPIIQKEVAQIGKKATKLIVVCATGSTQFREVLPLLVPIINFGARLRNGESAQLQPYSDAPADRLLIPPTDTPAFAALEVFAKKVVQRLPVLEVGLIFKADDNIEDMRAAIHNLALLKTLFLSSLKFYINFRLRFIEPVPNFPHWHSILRFAMLLISHGADSLHPDYSSPAVFSWDGLYGEERRAWEEVGEVVW